MPLYEYICEDCGAVFDRLRSMKEADHPAVCIKCQSSHTHRTISLFFAQSDTRLSSTSSSHGCSGCSGGACSSCRH